MPSDEPKKTIWDLARTAAKVGLPLLRGDVAVSASELFLAVFPSPYAAKFREYIDKNLKLEEVDYLKGLYHANMAAGEIPRVRVLHDGFDRYLRDVYAGYEDLYKVVVWFLLLEMKTKEAVSYGDVIANSNFPPVYNIHVLDDLNERRLVKSMIQDYPRDLSFVYGVSETLRRTAAS